MRTLAPARRNALKQLGRCAGAAVCIGAGVPGHAGDAPALPYDPRREALLYPQRHATVWRAGMTVSVLQLAVEAARLAYLRGEALPEDALRLKSALALVGLAAPQYFTDAASGAEAFATRRIDGTLALIAFRGTQPDALRDLLADAYARPVAWSESAGRVHAGFAAAARALLPQLQAWVQREAAAAGRLVLTGHSLGGAMAVLAASVLKPAQVFTLGAPRIGDTAFSAGVAALNCTRIVNCCDLVTRLPPAGPWFNHVGELLHITHDGQPLAAADAARVAQDEQAGRADYAQRWRGKSDALPLRDLADHAPINYVRAFY